MTWNILKQLLDEATKNTYTLKNQIWMYGTFITILIFLYIILYSGYKCKHLNFKVQ